MFHFFSGGWWAGKAVKLIELRYCPFCVESPAPPTSATVRETKIICVDLDTFKAVFHSYFVQSLYFNVQYISSKFRLYQIIRIQRIQTQKRDCILFALHGFSFVYRSVVWKHPISLWIWFWWLGFGHICQCRLGKFSEMLVTSPFWWTLQMSLSARRELDEMPFLCTGSSFGMGKIHMPHFTDLHRACLRSAQRIHISLPWDTFVFSSCI